jgi:predicted small metal-binding protein
MYEFRCGSPVCNTRLTAPTKDELMAEVGRHVAVKHRVPAPTRSMVQFLDKHTIREIPAGPEGQR